MNKYVEIKDIYKYYPVKRNNIFGKEKSYVHACDSVSLSINKGEILGVIGESGCGKSTLGRVITRLEAPTKGDVFIKGQSSSDLIKEDAKKFHRMVQIVFQNPYDAFTPRDTIRRIMLRPLKLHKIGKDNGERLKIIKEALSSGGLNPPEAFLERYPHQLSGGQLQRISIIRAMLLKPGFIVADEPVSMLDVSVRADIINMLISLRNNYDTTMIFISHDISLTRYISDKIAVMYLGRVVEYGDADEIVRNPQHPYTKVLISNCATGDVRDSIEKLPILGEPPTPIDPPNRCYFYSRCFYRDERCKNASYPDFERIGDSHFCACHKVTSKSATKEEKS